MVLAFYETSAPRLYKLQVGGQYVIMIQKPTNDLHTHSTPHSTPDPHSAHAAAQSAGKHSSPGCSSPAGHADAHGTHASAPSAARPSGSGGSPPLGNPSVDAHGTPPAASSTAKPSSSGSSPASQQRHQPTQEEIARRAYGYFLQRGQGAGQDKEDWFKAEQELLAKK